MDKDKNWSGFTLDELRFRRMLNLTKAEMERGAMAERMGRLWGGSMADERKGVVHKMLGALDYLDYALIAFSLGKKLFKIFRRK